MLRRMCVSFDRAARAPRLLLVNVMDWRACATALPGARSSTGGSFRNGRGAAVGAWRGASALGGAGGRAVYSKPSALTQTLEARRSERLLSRWVYGAGCRKGPDREGTNSFVHGCSVLPRKPRTLTTPASLGSVRQLWEMSRGEKRTTKPEGSPQSKRGLDVRPGESRALRCFTGHQFQQLAWTVSRAKPLVTGGWPPD